MSPKKTTSKPCGTGRSGASAASISWSTMPVSTHGIGRLEQTDLAQWQAIIDVNLTGVFLCCRWIGAEMAARGGSIINVSSIAGHVGMPRCEAYCAAKGGVELFSKSLATEWADKNIRVNCLAPGYFETDLTAALRGNDRAMSAQTAKTLMGRFGKLGAKSPVRRYFSSFTRRCLHDRPEPVDRWRLDGAIDRYRGVPSSNPPPPQGSEALRLRRTILLLLPRGRKWPQSTPQRPSQS